jgi:hypothetical protein
MAINPDLLVEREDGDFDIYDLKTALLLNRSIAIAKRPRRRFIQVIEDGIAQLAHYRSYFQYEQNRAVALAKYGATVRDPRLVLVAGTASNADPQEVEEALRRFGDVKILTYDALMQAFLRS